MKIERRTGEWVSAYHDEAEQLKAVVRSVMDEALRDTKALGPQEVANLGMTAVRGWSYDNAQSTFDGSKKK